MTYDTDMACLSGGEFTGRSVMAGEQLACHKLNTKISSGLFGSE